MSCDEYLIADNFKIQRTPYDLDKAKILSNLSEYHRLALKRTEFWAVATDHNLSSSDASIIINVLLLSLWIVGPIRATTFFKFSDYRTVSIIHSQIQHNEKDTFAECSDDSLAITSKFYKEIFRIYKKDKRLQTAIVNTYFGCVTFQWKVAFICFSAALETMLMYGRGPGITKRLAKTYACLTEQTKRQRNKAYRQFIKLYGIRSRIIHGEYRWLKKPDRNLTHLSNFSDLLRRLWRIVLSSKEYCRELEKGDEKRRLLFGKIEAGYIPPKVKII